MRNEQDPIQAYQSQILQLQGQLGELRNKKSRIAWLRLGAVLAAFAAVYLFWPNGIAAAASFLLFFALFLRLVLLDARNQARIDNCNTLVAINEEELKIAAHQFTERDDGSRFLPHSHAYATDLDIFGRASLYQYINRTVSEQGNQLLAQWLLEPSPRQDIMQRQEAARELSGKWQWRQQLQAYGMAHPLTIATEHKIRDWIGEENRFLARRSWSIVRYLLPAIILACLGLSIAGILPTPIFLGIAFIFFIISGAISKKIMPVYDALNKIAPQVDVLSGSAAWIEQASFQSPWLKGIQEAYLPSAKKASTDIKELKNILDRFDIRLNPLVFIPLNVLLLWDLQQAFALERWKEAHKDRVLHWFRQLGAMEAIGTLAALSFNHPGWCFPVISEEPGNFQAQEMGHLLIPTSKRVNNSFSATHPRQLSLITGSNMAGKSTFLRSIGVNIVLAMMGGPVCALAFSLYPMKVMSSMRIADNLEESTSTFYAELKKLKSIIEAVNRKEEIFILLDEILRGTNSLDRLTGSKALVRQLVHHGATGMIATHDLELAKLADTFPGTLQNYHFDVQVANDELYFDYKLKEGICHSMNASILMKKIGIEL